MVLAAAVAALTMAGPAAPAVTYRIAYDATGGCTTYWTGDEAANVLGNTLDRCQRNVFDGRGLGDTFSAGPRTVESAYIYHFKSDSWGTPHDHILRWNTADVFDMRDMCAHYRVACTFDPVANDPNDHVQGKFHYLYFPEPTPAHWFTAVVADMDGDGHYDFYVAIEGGKLPLTAANFDMGGAAQ